VLASLVFVAIVFVLTNEPTDTDPPRDRGPSLRVLFVTFFVFLVASFLWATLAGVPTTMVDKVTGTRVQLAAQPMLAVPAGWLLSIGAVLLFFAITWLVHAYANPIRDELEVSATARRGFRR